MHVLSFDPDNNPVKELLLILSQSKETETLSQGLSSEHRIPESDGGPLLLWARVLHTSSLV